LFVFFAIVFFCALFSKAEQKNTPQRYDRMAINLTLKIHNAKFCGAFGRFPLLPCHASCARLSTHQRLLHFIFFSMHAVGTLAHAKINLGLEVLHKRADLYHEINTIFVRVSLADSVMVGLHPSTNAVKLDCKPDLGIADEENLAYKAARRAMDAALRKAASNGAGRGEIPSLALTLRKQIPYGGGLGGGSSNAGATLRAIPSLWGESALSHEELVQIAASIGSDVPFFMENMACAIGAGRGEILRPLSLLLPYYIVIVSPNVRILTAWAYSALKRGAASEERRKPTDFAALITEAAESPNKLRQYFTNDFEEPIFAEYPVVGAIKKFLYESGSLFALMSGSGSSVFGFFKTDTEAAAVAAQARERFDGATAFVCKQC
jgi:4-diphosphocytidyl-2-C-methyl-D-erythritol kinase